MREGWVMARAKVDWWRVVLGVVISAVVLAVLVFLARDLIMNADSVTSLTRAAGPWGPLVLVLIIGLGILLTPIPNVVFIITASYLYGMWWGALFSYAGHLLAATGTFLIIRRFGARLQRERYRKYRETIMRHKYMLYILYVVPVIPISVTSILASTSRMPLRRFVRIIALSFIPPVLLFSFFGGRLGEKSLLELGAVLLVALIGFVLVLRWLRRSAGK